jgi:thiamine kinase-like enzyme
MSVRRPRGAPPFNRNDASRERSCPAIRETGRRASRGGLRCRIVDDLLAGLPAHDAERLRLVTSLATATRVVALDGGITNRNYRVCTPTRDYVVRLSDPESSLLSIDRDNEYLNSMAAAMSGAGAPVAQFVPGAGVLVVEWIEGRTFTPQDVADPRNLPRIADACRVLHSGPAFASDFDMFELQRRYLDIVRERGYRLPPRYDEFEPQVARMRRAMSVLPEPTVPCNNDLLAANIIDDGSRLWLIDYEYSGNNEASFELGNIWSESTLDDDLLEPLVTSYWGAPSSAKVARAVGPALQVRMDAVGGDPAGDEPSRLRLLDVGHGEVRARRRGVRRTRLGGLARRRSPILIHQGACGLL